MKKLLSVWAAVLFMTVFCAPAAAQDMAEIYVNGQYLRTDAKPLLADGTTFVPLRTVSSALGAEVSWQNDAAEIVLRDKIILLRPNSQNAVVNGQTVRLTAAPKMQEGRILVPLRFVSEQLGAEVNYVCYGGARHVVDITPAVGSSLPVNSGYAGAAEDGQYIYLVYENIYQFAKQSGEQTKLPITDIYPYKLCLADGCLYYSRSKAAIGNGYNLCRYDLRTGEETTLLDGAYRPYRYGEWLYYLDTPQYNGALYRVRLVGGAVQGEPEKLLPEVFDYWLLNDTIYYNIWGSKYFTAGLDGSGSQKLALNDNIDRQAYDAGYFYGMGRTEGNSQKLYRYQSGGEAAPYLLDDFAQVMINGKSMRSVDIKDIQIYGNIMYFSLSELAEYMPDHSGSVSGPLYARIVEGGNVWQLTKEKVLYYYVLRDKILYMTVVYDEQGNAQYLWRLIDNDLQDVFQSL